jgi:AAA+ superfamily predicted ATPase
MSSKKRGTMSEDTKALNVRDIPADVLKEAQKRAIDEGKTLAQIVREYLAALATGDKKPSPKK